MKKHNQLLLLTSLLLAILFPACRKNGSEEHFKPDDQGSIPDLTIMITTSVAGFVANEQGEPLPYAHVVAGNKETLTDQYGYFSIRNTMLPKAAGFIKVSNGGYFTNYNSFVPKENQESFCRVSLLTKATTGSVPSVTGGVVTTSDGAAVSFPANAVMTAAGNSYNGNIRVAARWLNPSNPANLQRSFPGDGRGLDSTGRFQFAQSMTSIAVELEDDAGQPLQIATGKSATITLPIPPALQSIAPGTISLWSFDKEKGVWKNEGRATRNGSKYIGQVSHFSYWQGAIGLPVVDFQVQVVNSSLQPLANVPVVITQANLPQMSGYGKMAYTDGNGYVYGAVPANLDLVMDIVTECATSVYSHPFTTHNTNIDLGTVTGNMGQAMVTITGTATDCNNLALNNGYVQTYDNGFYNRIPIINGSFSFSGLACINTPTSFIVVDENLHQQTAPATVTLVPGLNNLGAMNSCGISTLASVTYGLDGALQTVSEPAVGLAAYFSSPGGWTTVTDLDNNHAISFQFDGGAVTGSVHKVTDIFSTAFPSGRGYAPVPLNVTVTEYAGTGGFVSGNLNGLVLDFVSNQPYTFSCEFRVRRKN